MGVVYSTCPLAHSALPTPSDRMRVARPRCHVEKHDRHREKPDARPVPPPLGKFILPFKSSFPLFCNLIPSPSFLLLSPLPFFPSSPPPFLLCSPCVCLCCSAPRGPSHSHPLFHPPSLTLSLFIATLFSLGLRLFFSSPPSAQPTHYITKKHGRQQAAQGVQGLFFFKCLFGSVCRPSLSLSLSLSLYSNPFCHSSSRTILSASLSHNSFLIQRYTPCWITTNYRITGYRDIGYPITTPRLSQPHLPLGSQQACDSCRRKKVKCGKS